MNRGLSLVMRMIGREVGGMGEGLRNARVLGWDKFAAFASFALVSGRERPVPKLRFSWILGLRWDFVPNPIRDAVP